MTKPIPEYQLDIFTPDCVINAREVDDELREFAPVVRLADGTHMLGRHEHVAAGLLDWKAYSSASRPWHDPTSPRPEILLTDDPPRHTQTRKVIADALSPRALERVKGIFEQRAKELLARLRALLRRAAGHASSSIECGDLLVDTRAARATVGGAPIKLTSHEYKVLEYMMHHRGRVVPRTELVEHIYDQDFDRDSNTIEVFIGRLRRKIGQDRIVTERGLGYRLIDPAEQHSV